MEDLLSPDVLQSGIQVLDLAHNVLDLAVIGALDGAGLANGHVELEPDVAGGLATGQPSLGRGDVGRGEADSVVTRIGSAEGEAALCGAALAHNAVVVVEDFVDTDVDAHVGRGLVRAAALIPLPGIVVTCDGVSNADSRCSN